MKLIVGIVTKKFLVIKEKETGSNLSATTSEVFEINIQQIKLLSPYHCGYQKRFPAKQVLVFVIKKWGAAIDDRAILVKLPKLFAYCLTSWI